MTLEKILERENIRKERRDYCLTVKSDFVPLSKAVEILGVSQSTIYRYEKAGFNKSISYRRRTSPVLSRRTISFLEKMRNGDFSNCNAQKQLRRGRKCEGF